MNKIVVWFVHFSIFRIVDLMNFLERLFARSEFLYRLLLVPGLENFRWGIGAWRAWRNFGRSYRKVPAYKNFIDAHGGRPQIMLKTNLMPSLEMIPEMDKKNYIKKYSNEERIVGGKIPRKGVMIDESSGSSGTPTSWIRGPKERALSKQMLQLSYHAVMGKQKVIGINAFALGAWATGMNVSMSLTDVMIMKSTGPDIDKIVNTLKEFGPNYHYIIMGYPPFLKTLADDDRIKWDQYNVDSIFGGEGISEGMRTYLLKTFNSVIGSYGASDLEINIAAENPFVIELRRMIIEDEAVREALIDTSIGSTPMVMQYNPLAYYIETNKKGELLVTFARSLNISPKIRYNIHDKGHVIKHGNLRKTLQGIGKWDRLGKLGHKIDLPILFLYGRSDMSVDYYGANVTPDSIREILYGMEEIAPVLSTFKLVASEDTEHNKRMTIDIELVEAAAKTGLSEKALGEVLFTRLTEVNRDFYNAYFNTAAKEMLPKLKIHEYGKGPFEGGQTKLKHAYVETGLKYDDLK